MPGVNLRNEQHRALWMIVVGAAIILSAGCTSSSHSTLPASQSAPAGSSAPTSDTGPLTLASSAFRPGGMIPIDYSCAGENASPPLSWSGLTPAGTTSWAIVMQDLDVAPAPWIQWMITGIPARTRSVASDQMPLGAVAHRASNSSVGFVGLCPPQGKVHHYRFTVFALRGQPSVPASATPLQLMKALDGVAAGTATLTGRFAR